MFPFVSTVAQAKAAVQAMKYPPMGARGVAGIIRATDYGQSWKQYFTEANAKSLVVVQIETIEAVNAAEENRRHRGSGCAVRRAIGPVGKPRLPGRLYAAPFCRGSQESHRGLSKTWENCRHSVAATARFRT